MLIGVESTSALSLVINIENANNASTPLIVTIIWWFDWVAPAMSSLVRCSPRMLKKCTLCCWNVVHMSAFP